MLSLQSPLLFLVCVCVHVRVEIAWKKKLGIEVGGAVRDCYGVRVTEVDTYSEAWEDLVND